MAKTYQHPYPEHDKLAKIRDKSQAIGEFLEWLQEKGIHLGRYVDDYSTHMDTLDSQTNDLLAEYFEIDLNVLEDEKRAMLDAQRAANDA